MLAVIGNWMLLNASASSSSTPSTTLFTVKPPVAGASGVHCAGLVSVTATLEEFSSSMVMLCWEKTGSWKVTPSISGCVSLNATVVPAGNLS